MRIFSLNHRAVSQKKEYKIESLRKHRSVRSYLDPGLPTAGILVPADPDELGLEVLRLFRIKTRRGFVTNVELFMQNDGLWNLTAAVFDDSDFCTADGMPSFAAYASSSAVGKFTRSHLLPDFPPCA